MAVISILATLAALPLLRARLTANESVVVGNLRGLANGLAMYRVANSRYPAQWQADMYDRADPDYAPARFNADLNGAVTIQGYVYHYEVPADPAVTYTISARPVALHLTGARTFWVNEREEMFHCAGDSASVSVPDAVPGIAEAPVACP